MSLVLKRNRQVRRLLQYSVVLAMGGVSDAANDILPSCQSFPNLFLGFYILTLHISFLKENGNKINALTESKMYTYLQLEPLKSRIGKFTETAR